jgi:hypothetical protein
LALAEDVVAGMAKTTSLHFAPESAQVALDAAGQYLSGSGMPGSALLMLKLTALRATDAEGSIGPRHILQTLSQLSGLPVSILDTREQLDLKSVRNFFAARVIGQDEAVEAIVGRTDWRLFVCRTDRHRQDRARKGGQRISIRLDRPDDPARYERVPNP